MSGHRLDLNVTDDYLTAEWSCLEPETAPCRLHHLPEHVWECESWSLCPCGTDGVVAPDEVGHPTGQHDRRGHPLVPGRCNIVEWLENESWEESHRRGTQEVRSGPVEVEWDGDTYYWWFTDPAAGTPSTEYAIEALIVVREGADVDATWEPWGGPFTSLDDELCRHRIAWLAERKEHAHSDRPQAPMRVLDYRVLTRTVTTSQWTEVPV